jgi:hypothetical protein
VPLGTYLHPSTSPPRWAELHVFLRSPFSICSIWPIHPLPRIGSSMNIRDQSRRTFFVQCSSDTNLSAINSHPTSAHSGAAPALACSITAGACCVGMRTRVWGSGGSASGFASVSSSSFGFGSLAVRGQMMCRSFLMLEETYWTPC